jgi:hypothetical protein
MFAARADPNFRLWNVATNPKSEECGCDSDQEQDAPSVVRHDSGREQSGCDVTQGPPGLNETDGLATVFGRPDLCDQYGTGGPFASESETDEKTPEKELGD